MSLTWRDLWIRGQRKARANRFKLAHVRNLDAWDQLKIEWVKIDTEGLLSRQQTDAAKDPRIVELAKRKRLHRLEF